MNYKQIRHIMNPTISNISEEGDIYKFTLSGLNVSLANGLRRIILSEIPCVAIKTETYKDNQCSISVNTGRLHNEILKQRLSCIPIHVKMEDINMLPGKYALEVDVSNDTDNTTFVTTEHFKIKNKENGNYLTREETMKIFPPNAKTNSYIDFARLRPKISDSIPGESLKLSSEFSISSARDNSSFNVVSKCSYGNTPDLVKVSKLWDERESQLRSQEATMADIAFQKKNFYILDSQRSFVPDSFDFIIRTIGFYENRDIVKFAAEILTKKFDEMITQIDSGTVNINLSETTVENCYDIILENEDYTIGKIIEFILYDRYYMGDKTLTFCGFKKFHPHDAHGTVRIAFAQAADLNMVKQRLKIACSEAKAFYKTVNRLF